MPVGSSIGGGGWNQGPSRLLTADVGSQDIKSPSYAMGILEGTPGIIQGAGTTAFRGSNTIMRGGWADRRAARTFFRRAPWSAETGTIRGMYMNNNIFRPRTWTGYASQGMFFNDHYTPMGAVSGGVNWLAKEGRLGESLKLASGADGKTPVLRGGLLSQISAAERAGRSGLRGGQKKWVSSYLERGGVTGVDLADNAAVRMGMYQAVPGELGGQAAGYMASLRNPIPDFGLDLMNRAGTVAQGGTRAAPGAARAAEEFGTPFMRGMRVGSSALAEGGITGAEAAGKIGMRRGYEALKFATRSEVGGEAIGLGARAVAGTRVGAALGLRGAGMAIPYLNIALAAWTAYDLAKAIVPNAPKFAADTYTSYTGWNSRKMFGAGFKMNEAAMTSRSRGVMAIQNSRMNARSLLGNEAAGMANYYG